MLLSTLKTAARNFRSGRWVDAEAGITILRRPRDERSFADPTAVLDQLLMHELVSFDLFDTIVRRGVALDMVHQKTSEFADRFLRGDDGPLPRGVIAHARHRMQEEVHARTAAISGGARNEVDLADVFDAALAPYLRDPVKRTRAVGDLIAHEVEVEKAVLSVDPAMRELIAKLRRAGRRVILTSDMYLRAEHVEKILRHLGLRELFDHVFVSASVGVTKHSGLMFDHIDRELGLVGVPRVHVGDNLHSDVHQPWQRGWSAIHFHHPEREVAREALAIRSRLGAAAHDEAFQALTRAFPTDGALGFERRVAVAFAAFSSQVLQQAIQGRYDRVLFLTRDGTQFRRAIEAVLAGEAFANARLCPPLQDMAFSRRAGVLLNYPEMDHPGWHQFLIDNVNWLNDTPLSIRTVMRCFAVGIDELLGLTPELQAEVKGYLAGDDPATDLGFDGLLGRPELLEPLHAALAAKRDRARVYLEQIGLLDRDERILLVDIGYSGTALRAISEYMFARESAGAAVRSRLEMVVLAANRYHQGNLRRMHPRVALSPGLLIDSTHWRHRAAAANFSWLEPFAVDRTRGSMQDFAPDAQGRMQPIFAPTTVDAAEEALALRMERHMAEYSRAVLASGLPADEADRRMLAGWVSEILRPSRATVTAMRDINHHGGLGDVKLQPTLARIRPHRTVADIYRCIAEDRWVQGSLRQSGLGVLTPFVNLIIALESK